MILPFTAVQLALAQPGAQTAPAPAQKTISSEFVPASSRTGAPDLRLTDLGGKPLALAQYKGKVVLLDFWAVDCGGCVIEVPWYVEFDQKYRDKGLVVLGIDMYGEAPNYIFPFMAKQHMEYRVAVGNDQIRQQFHADELPKTLLIDRDGRIAVSHVGIVDKAAFEQDIQALLRESALGR
jgi:thiol-disulfide isomerase/thioredoxin